ITSSSISSGALFTHTLGHPRIGRRRQLKKAVESYWKSAMDSAGLEAMAKELRRRHWEIQRNAGIALPASNDFSLYDQVLDISCLIGNVPARFEWNREEPVGLRTYFGIARGLNNKHAHADGDEACAHCQNGSAGPFASEMTKWFDSNYHYIVP